MNEHSASRRSDVLLREAPHLIADEPRESSWTFNRALLLGAGLGLILWAGLALLGLGLVLLIGELL